MNAAGGGRGKHEGKGESWGVLTITKVDIGA